LGIFTWFLNRHNPTRNWQFDPSLELIIDLDMNRICGLSLGDSFVDLQGLGQAEDTQASLQGNFRYYSKGLEIDCDENVIESFIVHWSESVHGKFRPYIGKILYQGSEVTLDNTILVEQFVQRFGEPFWRDTVDEDETILFYEFGEHEWQAEFDRNDSLRCLIILSPPLLADEEQRKIYGVKKPWPPS